MLIHRANTYRLEPTAEQGVAFAQWAGACRSGIYCIRHSSGRTYVGSAKTLRNRISTHISHLSLGRHHNAPLQASWKKHGADAFIFWIIEEVEDLSLLAEREQYWIDTLSAFVGKGGFNVLPKARTPLGRKHSEATKTKIAAAHMGRKHSEQHRQRNSQARIGKPLSIEAAAKGAAKRVGLKRSPDAIRSAAEANRGKKRTAEQRKRMSIWQKGKNANADVLSRLDWTGRKHSGETKARMREMALDRERKKREARTIAAEPPKRTLRRVGKRKQLREARHAKAA